VQKNLHGKETKIVNQEAVILTDGQSFCENKFRSWKLFMDDIEIVKMRKTQQL
jgi:hypothetical protein